MTSRTFGRALSVLPEQAEPPQATAVQVASVTANDAQRFGRLRACGAGLLSLVLSVGCSDTGPNGGTELGGDGRLGGSNIVVIVIDTLRADRLPFYGHDRDTAPFLAELASESVLFENARSASSWTAPSTASLFTSLHPDQHGVVTGYRITQRIARGDDEFRVNRIPSTVPTLPELFAQAGYRTFAVTDNPNICEAMGFSRGFDRFRNFDYAGGEAVNLTLDDWLDEIPGDSPYFLYLHYMDPHSPYEARDPWYEAPADDSDPDSRDARLARYDSEISYVDQRIEQVFDWLDLRDDALVVVTSDHGEEFFEHGRWGHAFQLYEELVRVPFLIHGPIGGPIGARRVQGPVGTIDLLPTLLGLVGLPAPDGIEGRDLADVVLSSDAVPPLGRAMHALRTEELLRTPKLLHAVVRNDLKVIYNTRGKAIEAYDLEQDPAERDNLVNASSAALFAMDQVRTQFEERPRLAERDLSDPIQISAERQEMLKRLGYVEER